MKVIFDKALGGMKDIVSKIEEKEVKVDFTVLIRDLLTEDDFRSTLNAYKPKKLKGLKEKIYEIRLKDWRVIYILEDDFIYVLHIIHKKKNHTEKKYISAVKRRIKNIKINK